MLVTRDQRNGSHVLGGHSAISPVKLDPLGLLTQNLLVHSQSLRQLS